MTRWVALGVGVNNFATGRLRMAELTRLLADEPDLELIAWYGATGNLVVDALSSNQEVAGRISESTGIERWAVVTLEFLERALAEVERVPLPEPSVGVRWTRGLALPVEAPRDAAIVDTDRAVLRWSSEQRAVAVVKRDLLDEAGRLDHRRRLGGWGAISADVKKQVGGIWTARSLRTLYGLLGRME